MDTVTILDNRSDSEVIEGQGPVDIRRLSLLIKVDGEEYRQEIQIPAADDLQTAVTAYALAFKADLLAERASEPAEPVEIEI